MAQKEAFHQASPTEAFLMNCWYVAAWDHELIDGRLLARTILDKPVVLYKGDSGRRWRWMTAAAIAAPSSRWAGREGDCVRCMYHGLKFDATGKCVQIPGQDNIPPKLGVRGYPVVERDHLIWIWMGDAAKADPAKILDFPYMRDPGWRGHPGYLHYDANYLLIVDNLSDFAHLAFVHAKTLGGSEEYAFKSKPTAIERLGRRLPGRALAHERAAAAVPQKGGARPGAVDRRNIARMYVPGIFFMETLFSPAGSGAEKGNLAGAKQYRNCQFFTPETARSTHFFWDYLHDYELQDPNVALSLYHSMVDGFMEDKAIIETQQKTLEADPSFQMNAIVSDAPLVHFRRTLARRVRRGARRLEGRRA
jgi:vanillate O-demethylase monooxygenase subunit